MEWYWVITIIAGFLAVVGLLAYLGAKGILTKQVMGMLASVISGASGAVGAIAGVTENAAIDVFAMVMQCLDKAVLAAENSFYNDEISADQREVECMERFDELLLAAGITLTEAQRNVVGTLIKAACESMGHGEVAAKEVVK